MLEADGKTTEHSNHIGGETNNEAEYHALIQALQAARQSDYGVVEVYGNSQLVVKQVCGEWSVNEQHLRPLRGRARELADDFEECAIQHVPRRENEAANRLVDSTFSE